MFSSKYSKHLSLLIGILLALLIVFGIQSVVTYRYLAEPQTGANDYYSRWAGAKALLIEGRDPYDPTVTLEIQPVIGVDSSEVGRGVFHYPLHTIFLFWPLIYLPYPWAQAVWQTLLVWLAVATAVVILMREGWLPKPLGLLGVLLATIFLYPIARTVLLGQFTLHVTFFIALSLLLLRKEYDGWAGIALAATSIKPQLAVFVGLWLVIWALFQKRYRFIWGILGGGLLFFLAATAVYPSWLISFIEDLLRYAGVAGGRNPLLVLSELVGLGDTQISRYLLSAGLFGIMLYSWWRARHDNGVLFDLAVYWSLLVTATILFQTGTTNQSILLIPFLAGIYQLTKRWGGWKTAVLTALILGSLWVLFGVTISGDYENQIMFLPVPFLVFIGLVIAEWQLYRSNQSLFQPAD